jgi:hypothetical protein
MGTHMYALPTFIGDTACKAPLGSFNLPSAPFSHVHIDLVGPLPVSSGFKYCLTAIDRYTCWPEAHPLSEITAEAVAKAFVTVWVAHFGCPQQIITDQAGNLRPVFSRVWLPSPDPH